MKSTAKNKKILSILLVALVLCVIAGFGIYQMLSPVRTTVYLFNSDYPAGTQISKSMLTAVQVDSNLLDSSNKISTGEHFITSASYNSVLQSAGILRTDVYQGTALMKSMLTTTGGNKIEMTMKRNAVAVTVGATAVSGVTNELASGSRVNVYTSYDGQTSLPLQNIRVLSVGKSDGTVARVTLEVDVAQSMQLIHAYTYGTVHLGLVDATGYQYVTDSSLAYTTSGFNAAIPAQTDITEGSVVIDDSVVDIETNETSEEDLSENLEEQIEE